MSVVFTMTRNSLLIPQTFCRLQAGGAIGMVEHGEDGNDNGKEQGNKVGTN